jgi:hypothetical protein
MLCDASFFPGEETQHVQFPIGYLGGYAAKFLRRVQVKSCTVKKKRKLGVISEERLLILNKRNIRVISHFTGQLLYYLRPMP